MAFTPSSFEDKMRFAKPSDILQLGTIACAAFEPTQDFAFLRPYRKDHADDTFNSMCRYINNSMIGDGHAILVVEDQHQIVGFALWEFSTSSDRYDSFRNQMKGPVSEYPDIAFSDNQDIHAEHISAFKASENCLKMKHFSKCGFTLGLLAVLPQFQRRGHAKRLAPWGLQLAYLDKTAIGVQAGPEGVPLYAKIGFEHVDEFCLDGDDVSPRGALGYLMKFDPSNILIQV